MHREPYPAPHSSTISPSWGRIIFLASHLWTFSTVLYLEKTLAVTEIYEMTQEQAHDTRPTGKVHLGRSPQPDTGNKGSIPLNSLAPSLPRQILKDRKADISRVSKGVPQSYTIRHGTLTPLDQWITIFPFKVAMR